MDRGQIGAFFNDLLKLALGVLHIVSKAARKAAATKYVLWCGLSSWHARYV